MNQYQGGHGFKLEWTVIGDGWNIAALNPASVIVLWQRPNGTIQRNATSNDVVVTKSSDNQSVKIALLVKPGDHNLPGSYWVQAFDTTGGARVPSPTIAYTVAPSLSTMP